MIGDPAWGSYRIDELSAGSVELNPGGWWGWYSECSEEGVEPGPLVVPAPKPVVEVVEETLEGCAPALLAPLLLREEVGAEMSKMLCVDPGPYRSSYCWEEPCCECP